MRLLLALAITFGLLAAPKAKAEGTTHVIEISKMAFAHAPASIRVGDTIVWKNTDVVSHTATAFSGAFDVVVPAGGKGQTIVSMAGAIPYFCRFHLAMRSVLSVQP